MQSLYTLNESLKATLASNPSTAPAVADSDAACEADDPFGKERTAGLDVDAPKPKVESLSQLCARGARYLRQSR